MLLLHISDIHFHHPICTGLMDPDRPYRTRLVRDVVEKTGELGKVDAILVSGDIAYKGSPYEYEAGLAWLTDLAKQSGCPQERIFVVPGNHDVDREIIKRNPTVRSLLESISREEHGKREARLFEYVNHEDTCRLFLAPIGAYNNFAARFNCQVYAPDRLFWREDLPLDGLATLRIYGLTSTLLSGAGYPIGNDDTRESLYLSPLQSSIDPEHGVVNLVMSHHPPDWFMDHDNVDDAFCERATIHLLGHKHNQRLNFSDGYARFGAGAVNPNRYEVGDGPAYNLIELSVTDESGDKYLKIKAHLRILQKSPEIYVSKMSRDNNPFFEHKFLISRGATRGTQHACVPEDLGASSGCNPTGPELSRVGGEQVNDNSMRNLVFRFFSLPSSKRYEIASRLSLVSDDELILPGPELYRRALLRAKDKGVLEQVAGEILKAEGRENG